LNDVDELRSVAGAREMRRVFNRMFSEGFAQLPTERQAAQSGLFMPVDIAETSEEFVVTAELPGTNPGRH